MRKLFALVFATAMTVAAPPAFAQTKVGSLDALQAAHQLCHKATDTTSVSRETLTDRGWAPVRYTDTGELSDSILFSTDNPSLLVVQPGANTCFARTLVATSAEFETYLAAFADYNPVEQENGAYYFCADGRVAVLQLLETSEGSVIQAGFSAKVETGRCLSS